jgi:hypothetical protein
VFGASDGLQSLHRLQPRAWRAASARPSRTLIAGSIDSRQQVLPRFIAPGNELNENQRRSGRPAKIVPPRFANEARNSPVPRCAMETRPPDHQILELGESQEGKYETGLGGRDLGGLYRQRSEARASVGCWVDEVKERFAWVGRWVVGEVNGSFVG